MSFIRAMRHRTGLFEWQPTMRLSRNDDGIKMYAVAK